MILQDAGVVHEILYLTQSQRERDDCSCIYHAIKICHRHMGGPGRGLTKAAPLTTSCGGG